MLLLALTPVSKIRYMERLIIVGFLFITVCAGQSKAETLETALQKIRSEEEFNSTVIHWKEGFIAKLQEDKYTREEAEKAVSAIFNYTHEELEQALSSINADDIQVEYFSKAMLIFMVERPSQEEIEYRRALLAKLGEEYQAKKKAQEEEGERLMAEFRAKIRAIEEEYERKDRIAIAGAVLMGFAQGLSGAASYFGPTMPRLSPTDGLSTLSHHGHILGSLSANRYAPDSISNPYGAGSPYGLDGLNNPYSQYGSPYSNRSWSNPFATQAPGLFDDEGGYHGRLSTNRFDADSTSNPFGRYGSPFSPDSINNPYGRFGSPYSPDSPNNPYGRGIRIIGEGQ